MREIKVTIERYTPDQGNFQQEYIVPVGEHDVISVMSLLEYIYNHMDSTLGFFYHAACKQAACGKCMVKMNGKVILACKTTVEESEIHLAPYNKNVVRDLLCRG